MKTQIFIAHIYRFLLKSETSTFVYSKDVFTTCSSLAERQRQVLTNAIEHPANLELDKVLRQLTNLLLTVKNSRFVCKSFYWSHYFCHDFYISMGCKIF